MGGAAAAAAEATPDDDHQVSWDESRTRDGCEYGRRGEGYCRLLTVDVSTVAHYWPTQEMDVSTVEGEGLG